MKFTAKGCMRMLLAGLLAALFVVPALRIQAAPAKANVIADGVWVGNIDLSGKTVEEAKKLLDKQYKKLKDSKVKIYAYNNYANRNHPNRTEGQELLNSFFVPLSEFGFNWVVDSNLKEAVAYGQSGKLVERYKDLQNIKFDNLYLEPEYSVDEDAIRNYINENIVPEVNHDATDAQVSVNYPNVYVSQQEQVGVAVNVDKTTRKILDLFKDSLPEDLSCDAAIDYLEPRYTAETFAKMNGVLGEYVTYVDLTPETENRTHNIKLEMSTINGSVIMPGQIFSVNDTLGGETTPDKGYLPAGVYSGGQVIQEEGGGVCQGSTTLYNAALFAELEIAQRNPHSMTVAYVPFSRDAALFYPYKDLKLRNNTDAPIYLETFVSGNQVVARIYGHETRPSNRTLAFETITTRDEYAPIYKLDYDMNPGQPVIEGGMHRGITSHCVKKVLVNGVVVSEENLGEDVYIPQRQTVTIGCNTLNLYVEEKVAGFPKIYDGNGNQILVNRDGIPYYGNYRYLLVRDFETDEHGHAILNNGQLQARRSPVPTSAVSTATPPATTPEPTTEVPETTTEAPTETAPDPTETTAETTPEETTPEATTPAPTTEAPTTTPEETTPEPTTTTAPDTTAAPTSAALPELYGRDPGDLTNDLYNLGFTNIQTIECPSTAVPVGTVCNVSETETGEVSLNAGDVLPFDTPLFIFINNGGE